ncbi:uncharacterized protein LOC130796146 isoform X2 [Actinidia eriantha]|uniref:uncharacterized protein LOC130796146 isoform X2 n=1 Tax=Actinidia eriantha TaxID=165200 RepID=UPI00258D4C74|nr:uncharacterized protein LOC130796146 isoform X2 [Actinidia eriantha]
MDSIVHAAFEEVCSHGATGLAVATLWTSLRSHLVSRGLRLCDGVKKALWANILNISGLRFEAHGVSYDSGYPKIHSVDESERLELKIVAAEHLCNSFVKIYDIKASDDGISQPQRRHRQIAGTDKFLKAIDFLVASFTGRHW